jgi:hypothetical protein
LLRHDFDNHALWSRLSEIEAILELVAAEGVTAEVDLIENIRFYISHVRSFRDLSSSSSALFSNAMIAPVLATFDSVKASLDNRVTNGSSYSNFVVEARQLAEDSLLHMGPWPRPYARGGQVQQMSTLYEDLLERQRMSVQALAAIHEGLRSEIAALSAEVEEKKVAAIDEFDALRTEAGAVAATIEQQKTRIDDVVESGINALADTRTSLTKAYQEWQADRLAAYDRELSPFTDEARTKVEQASEALDKLRETEVEYTNLSGAVAAGRLSEHFEKEARLGRRNGILLYLLGFSFLAAAALPLVLLLQRSVDTAELNPHWDQIALRAAIAAVGASAATVAIRLGSRFITDATASKRMELELRTFGPFLANVSDQTEVDKARVNLIDRAFGKSYVGDRGTQAAEDTVPVSAFSQVVDAITKIAKP